MRPLQLDIAGFGAFAEPVSLDFTALAGHELFLVHGPTGAGKTTLFDAMSFALFGTVPGTRNGAASFRSDFLAASPKPSSVSFRFALGEQRLRIERVPEYERPRERGSGTARQRKGATLVDTTSGERVLATGWSETTAKVQELLGYDADSFRQVVVLPQGEFVRFLGAGVKEREELLARLFASDRHRAVADRLREQTLALRRRYDALQDQLRGALAGAATRTELDSATSALGHELEAATARADSLARGAASAATALERARAQAKAFADLDACRATLDRLAREAPAAERARLELHAARRAALLRALVAVVDDAVRRERSAAVEQRESAERLVTARDKAEAAARAQLQAEPRRPELDQLRARLQRLLELERDAPAHSEAAAEARRVNDTIALQEAALRAVEQELDALARATEATSAERRPLEAAASRLAALVEAAAAAGDLRQRATSLAELTGHGERLQLALGPLERAAEAAAARETALAAALHLARQRREQGLAGDLARGLAPGTPCPVCGATEHPRPAPGQDGVPEPGQLERAERELEAARGKAEHARAELRSARDQLDRARTDAAEHRERLAADAERDLAELVSAHEQAARQADDSRQAHERLARLAERAAVDERRRADAQRRKDDTLTAIATLAERRATLASRIATFEEQVRSASGGEPDLGAALNLTAEAARELQAAVDGAVDEARGAATDRARAEERASGAHEALRSAAVAREARERELAAELAAAGFPDRAALAAASRDDAAITALAERLTERDGDLAAATERAHALETELAGATRPDLAATELAERQARAAADDALRALGEARQRLSDHSATVARVAALEQQAQSADQELALAATVSELANGRNHLGLSYPRFVLAARLEEVLEAASVRLRLMSQGRYQLQRESERRDGREQAGLGIEVLDSWTGRARPAASLSGGESFLAALSLALGLSEVVQRHAGGLRLDSLFIDEGFGSLDEEALDRALGALDVLRGQGRLVGVISHVAELRHRIAARIEVTPGPHGSRLAVSVD